MKFMVEEGGGDHLRGGRSLYSAPLPFKIKAVIIESDDEYVSVQNVNGEDILILRTDSFRSVYEGFSEPIIPEASK